MMKSTILLTLLLTFTTSAFEFTGKVVGVTDGGNEITDVKDLENLTQLTELTLADNQISEADIETLKEALPNCEII